MVGWLNEEDSCFLKILRSVSIVVIVFGHVGGFWVCPPWSEFLHVFVPVFFFLSGAVSYNGYIRKRHVSQYLYRRIIGLLVPYYCISIFSLLIFLFIHSKFPEFNVSNLIKWITVMPGNDIMPFPLGQVWFLHVLVIIILISPVIFWIYQKSINAYIFIMFLSLIASSAPIVFNADPTFRLAGHNLFQPSVHIFFFCLGVLVFDNKKLTSRYLCSFIVVLCLLMSVFLVKIIGVNPDYSHHIYAPSLYYVVGCIGAIYFLLLIKDGVLHVYNYFNGYVRIVVDFFFRHTFSIFLIHTFSIFFVENVFGLSEPKEKTISYGIVKFILVLTITAAVSPAFTHMCSWISGKLNERFCSLIRI